MMTFNIQSFAAALAVVAGTNALAQAPKDSATKSSSVTSAPPPATSTTTAPPPATSTTTAPPPATSTTTAPPSVATSNSFLQFDGAPIELQLTTGLWLPRLRGNVTYGGTSAPNLDLSNDLNLDSLEPGFLGDLSATWKNWTLRATGTSFKSSGSIAATSAGSFGSTAFLAGQNLNNSFSYWTWGIETESWLWRPFSKQEFPWMSEVTGESLPVDLRIVVEAGGRGFGIDQTLTNSVTGSSTTFNETFGTVYGGAGFNIRFDTHESIGFIQRVDLNAVIAAGPVWPGDGGLFMQINAEATAWISNNVGVFFAYENLRQNVNTQNYDLHSYVGGLFMGLKVKF